MNQRTKQGHECGTAIENRDFAFLIQFISPGMSHQGDPSFGPSVANSPPNAMMTGRLGPQSAMMQQHQQGGPMYQGTEMKGWSQGGVGRNRCAKGRPGFLTPLERMFILNSRLLPNQFVPSAAVWPTSASRAAAVRAARKSWRLWGHDDERWHGDQRRSSSHGSDGRTDGHEPDGDGAYDGPRSGWRSHEKDFSWDHLNAQLTCLFFYPLLNPEILLSVMEDKHITIVASL